jgi:hypothetical protein
VTREEDCHDGHSLTIKQRLRRHQLLATSIKIFATNCRSGICYQEGSLWWKERLEHGLNFFAILPKTGSKIYQILEENKEVIANAINLTATVFVESE